MCDKSPQKCKEHETVISDLKEYFEFNEDGVRSISTCGTRWIGHKVSAMKRFYPNLV